MPTFAMLKPCSIPLYQNPFMHEFVNISSYNYCYCSFILALIVGNKKSIEITISQLQKMEVTREELLHRAQGESGIQETCMPDSTSTAASSHSTAQRKDSSREFSRKR